MRLKDKPAYAHFLHYLNNVPLEGGTCAWSDDFNCSLPDRKILCQHTNCSNILFYFRPRHRLAKKAIIGCFDLSTPALEVAGSGPEPAGESLISSKYISFTTRR